MWDQINIFILGGSPGLVVMGRDLRSRGRGFNSRHPILDGHFFTYICWKNCNDVCLKINESGLGPFKKTFDRTLQMTINFQLGNFMGHVTQAQEEGGRRPWGRLRREEGGPRNAFYPQGELYEAVDHRHRPVTHQLQVLVKKEIVTYPVKLFCRRRWSHTNLFIVFRD